MAGILRRLLKQAASTGKRAVVKATTSTPKSSTLRKTLKKVKARQDVSRGQLVKGNVKPKSGAKLEKQTKLETSGGPLTPAAKARQQASLGQRKPIKKAPTKIKAKPAKRTSTVKSTVPISETARRRAARRSSTTKSKATGDQLKIAKIREAGKDGASTSARRATIKAAEQRRLAKVSDGLSKSGSPGTKVKSPKAVIAKSRTTSGGKKTVSKSNAKPDKVDNRFRKDEATGSDRRIARSPGLTKKSDSRVKSKTTTKTLPKSEKVRIAKSGLRDRGAAQVTKRTPKNSADTAQAARGDIKSATRGDKETFSKRSGKRTEQQQMIQDRRSAQLEAEGTKQRKGRTQRLSAADARAAADQYEIDKMKEITKTARTKSGREASDYMRQAKKEMKREAASIRSNARNVSDLKIRSSKNNESPSMAYQEPSKMKGSNNNRTSANAQTRGERLSKDMTQRTSGVPVRERRTIKSGTKTLGQGGTKVTPKAGANSTVSQAGPGPRASKATQKAKPSTKTETLTTTDRSGVTSTRTRPTDSGIRGEKGSNVKGPVTRKKPDFKPSEETKRSTRATRTDANGKKEPMYGRAPGPSPKRQAANELRSSKAPKTNDTPKNLGSKERRKELEKFRTAQTKKAMTRQQANREATEAAFNSKF